MGQSVAEALISSGAGVAQGDSLGDFIDQNMPAWEQRQANYDQIVGEFGTYTNDGLNDVRVAGPGGYRPGQVPAPPGSKNGDTFSATYAPPGGYMLVEDGLEKPVSVLDKVTVLGRAAPGSGELSSSAMYSQGLGDIRETVPPIARSGTSPADFALLDQVDGPMLQQPALLPEPDPYSLAGIAEVLANTSVMDSFTRAPIANDTPWSGRPQQYLSSYDPAVNRAIEARNAATLNYMGAMGSSPLGGLAGSVTMAVTGNVQAASATIDAVAPLDGLLVPMGGRAAMPSGSIRRSNGNAPVVPPAPKGANNPITSAASARGSSLHVDRPGNLPDQLRALYPDTTFEFTKPGVAGQDVRILSGTHPSDYPGSAWPNAVNFADFKPGTSSGARTFDRDQRLKWPQPTYMLPYDPTTGKLK